MVSCNTQYLQAVIQYLSVLEEEKVEPEEVNGKETYRFKCPFCSQYTKSPKCRKNKHGSLIRTGENSWIYSCKRGWSNECRGGARSFHNFLALLHPGLFKDYLRSLNQG